MYGSQFHRDETEGFGQGIKGGESVDTRLENVGRFEYVKRDLYDKCSLPFRI